MSENKNIVSPASVDTAEIVGQVFEEENRPPEDTAKKDENGSDETSVTEKPSTDVKPEEEAVTATSDEDGQQDKVKFGNREFATEKEALKEAERVIGHNANLANELTKLKSEAEEVKTKLEEAIGINEKWVEWAEDTERGENKEKPGEKVEDIVRRVLAEYDRRNENIVLEKQLKEEVNKIQTLTNFDEVLPMLQDLATKTNPLTGKFFTPFEAYKFACWDKGLDNLLEEKKEKPKPVPSADMAQIATRPSGGKNEPPKKGEEADEVSDILSQYL